MENKIETTKGINIEEDYKNNLNKLLGELEPHTLDLFEGSDHDTRFNEEKWLIDHKESNNNHETLSPKELNDSEYRFIDIEKNFLGLTELEHNDKYQLAYKTADDLTTPRAKFKPSLKQIEQLDKLAIANPNFTDFYSAVSDQMFLHASTKQTTPCTILPILLVGGPGVGKTYATKLLAEVFNLYNAKINLSNATEAFILSGCPRGYNTSIPGEVAAKLSKSDVINPLIIADEIDKASFSRVERPSVIGPLLTLLESDTAKTFEDSCLRMDIDASHISWVATANSLEGIPEPILSRFQIFHIAKLSADAMHKIIEKLSNEAMQIMGLNIEVSIDQDVKAINVSTRDLKKALLILIPKKYRAKISTKIMHITASDLRPYLRKERDNSIGFHRI